MDPLRSWILIIWGAVAIVWIVVQAYRIQKWKEENVTNLLPK